MVVRAACRLPSHVEMGCVRDGVGSSGSETVQYSRQMYIVMKWFERWRTPSMGTSSGAVQLRDR